MTRYGRVQSLGVVLALLALWGCDSSNPSKGTLPRPCAHQNSNAVADTSCTTPSHIIGAWTERTFVHHEGLRRGEILVYSLVGVADDEIQVSSSALAAVISQPKALVMVEFSDFGPGGSVLIGMCPEVVGVEIQNAHSSSLVALQASAGLSRLKRITLNNTGSSVSAFAWSSATSLTSLKISGDDLAPSALLGISQAPQLTYIDAKDTKWDDSAYETMRGTKSNAYLSLGEEVRGAEYLRWLVVKQPEATSLALGGEHSKLRDFSIDDLECILQLPNIATVHLDRQRFDRASSLHRLTESKTLREVIFWNCDFVGDVFAEPLVARVEAIELHFCYSPLAESWRGLTKLVNCDLFIDEKGMDGDLFEAFRQEARARRIYYVK